MIPGTAATSAVPMPMTRMCCAVEYQRRRFEAYAAASMQAAPNR